MKRSMYVSLLLIFGTIAPLLAGCTPAADDTPKTKDPTPAPVDQSVQPPKNDRAEGPKKGVKRGM